jgi:DNA-binding response OmpR family regulator
MAHTILIADDDPDIVALCTLYLKDLGQVVTSPDGRKALSVFQRMPVSLAIIDIMMPEMNGYQLMADIKRLYPRVPILVISAKTLLEDKVLGFQTGADDYLCKPFDPEELYHRARALLRRSREIGADGEALMSGDFFLDLSACQITRGSERHELTATESRVLAALMIGEGRVKTLEQLYEAGWGDLGPVNDNAIRVCINKLRKKTGENRIKTIRGIGYRWEPNETEKS